MERETTQMDSVMERELVTHKIEDPGVASGMEARMTISKSQMVWIKI